MLTETQINENKQKFLTLIDSITREGVDKVTLVRQLTESDFFTAPASTIYHCAYRGGLCYHSLNVYDALCRLLKTRYEDRGVDCPYSEDTIKIVALLHDMSKMNYYETYAQNKKEYSDSGSKRDELGKFDWVTTLGYKRKDAKDRFLYGNHEYTSLYMVETFVPLSLEESIAITHHMGGMSPDSAQDDLTAIYSKYNLSVFLHLADMYATYTMENDDE